MARARNNSLKGTADMETPEQVKNAARAAAAAKINALFVDPAKLNDIGRLKSDYQQMLSVVDSEIRSVQDAKLAAAGQVQDTLEAVHGQMRRLRDQHEELSSLVSYCQGLLAPYPKIREASAARQNLREVLAYIERFNTSIDLVDDLERVVDEPLMLMELWKEMQRLLEWRNFMLERLRVAEVDARASTSDRSEEQEHFVAMLAFVGEQFARVANLRNSMVDKLLAIVEEQVTELAPYPALLVQCVQVMEAVELAQKVEKHQAVEQAREAGEEEELVLIRLNHIDLRDQVVARLRSVIRQRAADTFVRGQMEMADREVGSVRATLNAASQLLSDLTVVRGEVAPCFPPSIDILMIWREVYEEFLVPQISSLYDDNHLNDLDGEDLLTINEWLDYYNSLMPMIDAGGPCQAFLEDATVMLAKYLDKLDAQMGKWLQNIDTEEFPVQRNLDGTLFTNKPEMYFQLVQMQIKVAKERLSGTYLSVVFLKVLDLLSSEQRKAAKEEQEAVRASLEPGAEPLTIEVLAAVVNDCSRLQDKLEEVMDGPVAQLEAARKFEERGIQEIRERVQQLSSDYTLQATHANEMVVACIMSTDLAGAFADQFSRAWEANPTSMSTIVQTLKDYFRDLKRWISQYFFCKMLRSFLENLVNDCVSTLLLRQDPFQDPAKAAKNMRFEYAECVQFFQHYEDELAQAGVRPPLSIPERVDVLNWAAEVLVNPPTEALATLPAASKFMLAFGDDGPRALVRLVGLNPNAPREAVERAGLQEAFAAAAKVHQMTRGARGNDTQQRFTLDGFDFAEPQNRSIKGRLGLSNYL